MGMPSLTPRSLFVTLAVVIFGFCLVTISSTFCGLHQSLAGVADTDVDDDLLDLGAAS